MAIEIDDLDNIDATRVRPIPWARFKALVLENWPGPPECSRAHAKQFAWTLAKMEALDLADAGDPPRAIAGTADITIRMVRRFVASMPADYSPFTLKSRLAVLRCVCQFAAEHRWVAVNPFALRKMARWVKTGRPTGKRHLTRAECTRLLMVLEGDCSTRKGWALWKAWRIRTVVCIALFCGLRKMELLRLQVGDLDLPGRLVHVRPHGKSLKTDRSMDSVPLPDALVPVLEEWLARWRLAAPDGFEAPECPWLVPTCCRTAPWVSGHLNSKAMSVLKQVAGRAGIEHITFQMCRRTCATLLEGKGVGSALVARILRHSEAVDAAFYRQRDEDAMKAAAKDLQI